jgi:hypothetical protein
VSCRLKSQASRLMPRGKLGVFAFVECRLFSVD